MGAIQFGYEVGTFGAGVALSKGGVFSLDGFVSPRPATRIRGTGELNDTQVIESEILQEFGLKAHMVNTYETYRDAARVNGELPIGMETKSVKDLFFEPFNSDILSDPWVFAPIALVLGVTIADYWMSVAGTVTRTNALNSSSNALYAMNYGIWQPIGSGAPEEMFYRGFLQNEFKDMTSSAPLAIAMSSTLFALSHMPGSGRDSAALVGAYLGFLANKNNGKLGPGIAVHFWGDMILGLETILLNHKGQRTTPPTGLQIQVNF